MRVAPQASPPTPGSSAPAVTVNCPPRPAATSRRCATVSPARLSGELQIEDAARRVEATHRPERMPGTFRGFDLRGQRPHAADRHARPRLDHAGRRRGLSPVTPGPESRPSRRRRRPPTSHSTPRALSAISPGAHLIRPNARRQPRGPVNPAHHHALAAGGRRRHLGHSASGRAGKPATDALQRKRASTANRVARPLDRGPLIKRCERQQYQRLRCRVAAGAGWSSR